MSCYVVKLLHTAVAGVLMCLVTVGVGSSPAVAGPTSAEDLGALLPVPAGVTGSFAGHDPDHGEFTAVRHPTPGSGPPPVKIYDYTAPTRYRDFIIGNLHAFTRCAEDGRDQPFGIPRAFSRPWGAKQGWSGWARPCRMISAASKTAPAWASSPVRLPP